MKNKFILLAAIVLASAASVLGQSSDADRQWVDTGVWRNGFAVDLHPSSNASEFRSQYEKNKEVYDSVFTYLAGHDLAALPTGRYDLIPGRCWVNVQEYVPGEASNVGIEMHKRFIDLQYTLSGNEKMGYAGNPVVSRPYDEKADIGFWKSDDITYYPAGAEAFFLFFPSDAHQPSVRTCDEPGTSRKIVVKIEYKE